MVRVGGPHGQHPGRRPREESPVIRGGSRSDRGQYRTELHDLGVCPGEHAGTAIGHGLGGRSRQPSAIVELFALGHRPEDVARTREGPLEVLESDLPGRPGRGEVGAFEVGGDLGHGQHRARELLPALLSESPLGRSLVRPGMRLFVEILGGGRIEGVDGVESVDALEPVVKNHVGIVENSTLGDSAEDEAKPRGNRRFKQSLVLTTLQAWNGTL